MAASAAGIGLVMDRLAGTVDGRRSVRLWAVQYTNWRFVVLLWTAQLAACVQLQTHKFPFPFDT